MKYLWSTLAGAERSSALQRAGLAQVMPTHKRHSVPGDLQFLTSSTYRRAKLLESDRLLAAELRPAPAGGLPGRRHKNQCRRHPRANPTMGSALILCCFSRTFNFLLLIGIAFVTDSYPTGWQILAFKDPKRRPGDSCRAFTQARPLVMMRAVGRARTLNLFSHC